MKLPVVEMFVSINGEGQRAGELAAFIRFRGCNLNCSYCDTLWANSPDAPADELEPSKIVEFVNSSGAKNVTLTGGEPLLQKNISELINALIHSGHRVEIETNGSISIAELASSQLRPAFTLDYKLPDSGMEKTMLTDNYRYLTETDTVKFVVSSLTDMERAVEIIDEFSLTKKCAVYFSPVFDRIEPSVIVDFMKERRLSEVRLQLQLHKFIWAPDKRGV